MRIYASNQTYFDLAGSGPVTTQFVLNDLDTLPPGCRNSQKAFGLIVAEDVPVAVFDGILGYPDPHFLYIGLLLVDAQSQSCGVGARILQAVEKAASNMGLQSIRLGVMADNHRAHAFWLRQGFVEVERVKREVGADAHLAEIVVMKKAMPSVHRK